MSFLPVSEAIQRLEIDGLVESKARVGTRVRIPAREEIIERYAMREALETQAARLCAEHAGESGREELRKMAFHRTRCMRPVRAPTRSSCIRSTRTICVSTCRSAELGGNTLLRRAIEREQVLIFNWLFDTAAQQRRLPPHFHTDIAAALTGPTVEGADQAMRLHMRHGLDRVLAVMNPPPSDENGWRLPRNAGRGAATATRLR